MVVQLLMLFLSGTGSVLSSVTSPGIRRNSHRRRRITVSFVLLGFAIFTRASFQGILIRNHC
ncbi:hypothetical protein HanXRQr2_Chr05g0221891 [Helianthus annuus]|uniref:Secreted protein n=1 Tax=Helianthus annuus TaxID=4232 RepID=A0A9K3J1A5_HELAN|nr:hypothetical protein HanXRQr2_Chr05g0221891 [Helianthus annuus]